MSLRGGAHPLQVSQDYLSGYVAMVEFRRNLNRISPAFIAALVALHTDYT